jgi:hypothetical protein
VPTSRPSSTPRPTSSTPAPGGQRQQNELNDLTNYLLGGRRASLSNSVEQYNQKIAEAQRAIDDLEEQARRAGIP